MTKLPNKTKIIGNNIRNIRLFKKIKAKEVAAHCGISAGHYQMLESGRRRINIEHIFAIAEALGVPPEKLINPDITTYSPSGRALPLVKIAALNAFSTCPDKDSVEKIANQICLCPPEVTDERAFAVELTPKPHFRVPPEERVGIVICVPSKVDDLPEYEAASEFDPEQPVESAELLKRAIPVLLKLSRHPVYYGRIEKMPTGRQGEKPILSILTYWPLRDSHLLATTSTFQGLSTTVATVEWLCLEEASYLSQMTPLVTARKRPPKKE